MHEVSLDDAGRQLGELVDEATRGGAVILTREGRPVARIVPVHEPAPRRRFGSARGEVILRSDFDAPLDDFAEYTR